MPANEAMTQWCAEARRILKLAQRDRAAPEKVLEKSLLEQHAALVTKLGNFNAIVALDATVVAKGVPADVAETLRIVRSQINIGSYVEAADSLLAIGNRLDDLIGKGKAQARAAVLSAGTASASRRTTLKAAMADELMKSAGATPSKEVLAELRRLADDEFKRDAEQAELLKLAGALNLDLPPPPARTAFADNATDVAKLWTAAVCEAAFSTYTWFDFKAFRKQGDKARLKIDGLTEKQALITDDVMWRLYQFRRQVVDDLVAELHTIYPGKLLFSSNGSEDIESDLDITVASPHGGDDVAAMAYFNKSIKKLFGRPPGRVFDTNLYARDYNAIKADNLTKEREGDAPVDHPIAEPGGNMQRMANIDQDVATLMKQRRFMDGEAFTRMWEGLRDSMLPKDRAAIEQAFEEAESAYLMTALVKVDAIEKKIKEGIKAFDDAAYAERYGPERAAGKAAAQEEFAQVWYRYSQAKKAHVGGKSGGNTAALLEFQRLQNEFLDFMEANFEDEVMEATDEIYAERMADLRADQMFIQYQEEVLAESQASDKELAEMRVALASAKARAKQAQFTNIIFANEAYVSQGAITHVVSGKQAGDASVLARITPAELMQSSNEQLADFLKDMKHMEHEVPAGEVGDDKGAGRRRATGEAFVHASKYLARMLEAVAMLEAKYTIQLQGKGDEADAALAELIRPYPLVQQAARTTAEVTSPKALQLVVEGHLLKLRKSSTIPGDVKAEMALAEAMALFNSSDIPALRGRIQAFCTEFNKRVRSLDDFRQSQAVDGDTFRQYFDPDAKPAQTAAVQ